MNKLIFPLLLFFCFNTVAGTANWPDPALEGGWVETWGSTRTDASMADEDLRIEILVFKQGKVTHYKRTFHIYEMAYRTNTNQKPATLDWDNEDKNNHVRGIYQIENDRLDFCHTFNENDAGRPLRICEDQGGEQATDQTFRRVSATELEAAIQHWHKKHAEAEQALEDYVAQVNRHLVNRAALQEQHQKSIQSVELWSTHKDCQHEDAFWIEITSFGDAYQLAGCAIHGCRITLDEFAGTQPKNYRKDKRIKWHSRSEIELQLNGQHQKFYRCHKPD